MIRRTLVALVGTAGVVLSLASCADSADQPTGGRPEQVGRQGGSTTGSQAGSPGQELAGIGSTLDAIDSELAADGSP
ncbi:hypothetical protein [Kribbella swartbergensis]